MAIENTASPRDAAAASGSLDAPSLRRRMAAWAYEGVLLFGVLMLAGLLFGVVAQQRHALQAHLALQAFLFVVLGGYFAGFWSSHRGQTVAMRAWRIRLVAADGGRVPLGRAAARYVLAWLWFVPALATLGALPVRSNGFVVAVALTVGVVAYASLVWLRPDRQFWHDAVCGTRIVDARNRGG